VGAVSGSVVFFSDFFLVFELGDSLSVADSVFGDFSVFASDFSDFLVLLFSALLFFSLEVLVLFDDGLVALSEAGLFVVPGLFVVEGDFVVAGAAVAETIGFVVALVAGVMVAATDAVAAGVIVAPTLAVAAGVALALVEAALVVVVPVVVVPVVVADTPNVVGTVTP
jgi:hypothetical protein